MDKGQAVITKTEFKKMKARALAYQKKHRLCEWLILTKDGLICECEKEEKP